MQLTLNFETAQQRKESGMSAALNAAGSDWKSEATRVVLGMVGEFQAEEVRAKFVWPESVSPNAWGGLFAGLVKQGRIVATGEWRTTKAVRTHGHRTAVYRVMVGQS